MENTTHIKMLRLYSGEYIIGEIDDAVAERPLGALITVKNPRVFALVPTMTGEARAVLQPLCPFSEQSKSSVDLHPLQVMLTVEESELSAELLNGYRSHVSGIKLPTASETAVVNGGLSL